MKKMISDLSFYLVLVATILAAYGCILIVGSHNVLDTTTSPATHLKTEAQVQDTKSLGSKTDQHIDEDEHDSRMGK